MADRTVIQWDKDDLESLGLLKVDVLALGMLTRTAPLLRSARSAIAACESHAWQDIPPKDTATYDMICRADTVGVFQIESRAQMSMLPRLQPRSFYDLVIEVAIVRPGPDPGRHGASLSAAPRGPARPSPIRAQALEHVLKRTLGVPIFQEQVMQIAMVAADFTPGEADGLRRAMAAWKRRGGLEPYRERLLSGMANERLRAANSPSRSTSRSWASANTAFPSRTPPRFALLTYVSCWLKCHEPAAFAAALINSQPMGFYAPAQITQDAAPQRRDGAAGRRDHQRLGLHARTPDRRIATRPALRLGLRLVRGLPSADGRAHRAARAATPFGSIDELGASRAAVAALVQRWRPPARLQP